ncbi:MAG: mechanosensitive ion channel family protein [Candidatus Omnitrophica bacterium]|nr:mechanosensitive ion channel family protein [Candidatus Omnitrophota bacterium]
MGEQISAFQKLVNTAIEFIVNYSFQALGAVIVLIAGSILAGWVQRLVLKLLTKKKLDVTLAHFLASSARISVFAIAAIIALGKFGITIAPFVAALGAAAFGATYAIQGPLSNYGAGLSIILGRPFVVGDTITVAGVSGVVVEVKLAATLITDEDGVRITVPNKHIVGEILYNSKTNKIVESVIGISYDSDTDVAINTIQEILLKHSEVVRTPLPHAGIQAFAESSINIGFRYWVPTATYYKSSYAVNNAIFKAITAAGIKIPFPQREVRLVKEPV